MEPIVALTKNGSLQLKSPHERLILPLMPVFFVQPNNRFHPGLSRFRHSICCTLDLIKCAATSIRTALQSPLRTASAGGSDRAVSGRRPSIVPRKEE